MQDKRDKKEKKETKMPDGVEGYISRINVKGKTYLLKYYDDEPPIAICPICGTPVSLKENALVLDGTYDYHVEEINP